MHELETLLNLLITRGWKPWGMLWKIFITENELKINRMKYPISYLKARESGLWDFLCLEGILNWDKYIRFEYDMKIYYEYEPEFWILSTCLLSEKDFICLLLNKIQI